MVGSSITGLQKPILRLFAKPFSAVITLYIRFVEESGNKKYGMAHNIKILGEDTFVENGNDPQI